VRRPLIFIGLIVITASYSCRKEVQDTFPDFPAYPVVNSIICADSLIRVHVSLTGKLDTIPLGVVDNANVLLYAGDSLELPLPYSGEGLYTSAVIAKAGKSYSCEVSLPGFIIAYASDTLPLPTTVTNIIHTDDAGLDEEGLTYPALTFTLANDPGHTSYYEVCIHLLEHGITADASLIHPDDPVILNEGLPIAVFSNELMNDTSYTMKLNYTSGQAGSLNGGPMHTTLFPLLLEVRSISYDLYRYVKQISLYETSRYPDIVGGVVTTFPLYSNVENGYGIVAGYSAFISDTIFPESIAGQYGHDTQ
jgi:hypothetical protein